MESTKLVAQQAPYGTHSDAEYAARAVAELSDSVDMVLVTALYQEDPPGDYYAYLWVAVKIPALLNKIRPGWGGEISEVDGCFVLKTYETLRYNQTNPLRDEGQRDSIVSGFQKSSEDILEKMKRALANS